MPDFPNSDVPHHLVLSSFDMEAAGVVPGISVSAPSGATNWPANNRIIYIPCRVRAPFSIVRFFWINGTAVGGNVQAGIYSVSGALLSSCPSTGQAVTNGSQGVAPTGGDYTVTPGVYYLAITLSTTAGRIWRLAPVAQSLKAYGLYDETPGVFGLPTTATFAAQVSGIVPLIGIASHTYLS